MGLDRTVRFPTHAPPSWEAIRIQLSRVGAEPRLMMIDGLPAFPDESPPAGWRELRVGTPAGIVAIRLGTDSLTCAVWGNAQPDLLEAWNRVCWACAAAGSGVVETSEGPRDATAFAAMIGLSPA